ncbi:hypothetical protein [Burkholderia territorii]|uniref:hypothetical protein n=1 Tax=Burkholderia territorii TaxID=1503055 RepID=UPI000757D557|nr:hypothetical protein [Burkholderia territorii]KWO50039.1 hypothetical protein WT98_17040 [Burkholderia territorii]
MLVQKFHHGMRLGQQPTIAASGNPLFSRQGHWDGGSTLHCVAMALALLGKLNDPVYLPYHPFGPEQIVWDDAWPHYLTGLTLEELAEFVANLNLDVRPAADTTTGMDLLRFVERELQAGWPVIVGWQQRQTVRRRAALAVGIEGRQSAQAFEPHALLLLDPSGDAPGLAGFNARIDMHDGNLIRYWSASVVPTVSIVGALSIRVVNPHANRAVT